MRVLGVLLLVATVSGAAGCSSKDDPAAAESAAGGAAGWQAVPAVSGTRLRATFIAGGGSRELAGFHDSERNEDCTFQRAEAGHWRCLPATTPSFQNGIYSDAACQHPVASAPACGSDVKYAVTYRYDGSYCNGAVPEIRSVLGAANSIYSGGPGGCVPQTLPPGAAPSLALGDVVPWTAFVEGVETSTSGGAVAETVLVSADGARQHLGFRIERLDADCTFQLMPDGVTRCVPAASTGPVIYTDSECTKPSFVNDNTSSVPCASVKEAANLWVEPSIGTCAGARAVYSLQDSHGGEVAPYDDLYAQQVRSSGSGPASDTVVCTSMGQYGQSSGRRAIEADITSSLPTTARVGSGAGRLVPALVSSAAIAATPGTPATPATSGLTIGWHDNERDADCTFVRASDGKLRCLPTGAAATVFHTDTGCTSPSLVAVLDQVSCLAARFARVTSKTCPVTTRVYALGSERRNLTSASTETAPGHCPSFSGVNGAVDATEVDPAGFVEGVPVTD